MAALLALAGMLALGFAVLQERSLQGARGKAGIQPEPPQASSPKLGKLERAVAGLGYRINLETTGPLGSDCWSRWECSQFELLSKREWFAKSRLPMPGSSDTFHRFHVWEEVFHTPEGAQARLDRYRTVPGCAPIEQREYWLAAGFRCGSTAYILHTDAVSFLEVLRQVAGKLEKEICGEDRPPDVRK